MKNLDAKKPRSRRKRVLFVFAMAGSAIAILSTVSGVPVFQEFRDAARRVSERALPVEPLAVRARRTLNEQVASTGLRIGAPTFVRIFKQEAQLEVWLRDGPQYRLFKTFPICRHSGFLGPKLKEGDKQAPEGFYTVTRKQLNPGSRHYRAFNLGFPNEFDRAHGRTGSALMVHGGCTSVGCYAMTDFGVAQIYTLVEKALSRSVKSVPVHVFPFRMTENNMARHPAHRWSAFWGQLKQGYDLFEQTKVPPKVSVCGKAYSFGKPTGQCRTIAGW